MEKGVKCSDCGRVEKKVCSVCWRCLSCCDCPDKKDRLKKNSRKKMIE